MKYYFLDTVLEVNYSVICYIENRKIGLVEVFLISKVKKKKGEEMSKAFKSIYLI